MLHRKKSTKWQTPRNRCHFENKNGVTRATTDDDERRAIDSDGNPRSFNPRQELIASLRGRFLVPVISTLAELGLLPRMREASFTVDDFDQFSNRKTLAALFRYLESLALLQSDPGTGRFTVTRLGSTVFRRSGAFLLLNSYRDYFDRLEDLLTAEEDKPVATVDRAQNVLGSGSLHRRKFFPAALDLLDREDWRNLVDLGCGDGTFLSLARERNPSARLFGVDLSPIAVSEADRHLAAIGFQSVVCSAQDVAGWSAMVPEAGSTVIAMWFVLHEFVAGDTDVALRFFRNLHAALPRARVVLGEIVAIAPEDLADSRHESIAPEFLLFHSLSGQGVLTWPQFLALRREFPYRVVHESRIDEVRVADGSRTPSSFLWYLEPRS